MHRGRDRSRGRRMRGGGSRWAVSERLEARRFARPIVLALTAEFSQDSSPLTRERLEAIFHTPEPLTVGLEEEVMLLDPATLDLAPVSEAVLDRLRGDASFKLELPASQVEIVTEPARDLASALTALRDARHRLAAACEGLALPAAAGVHPFAEPEGELTASERY